MQIFAEFPRGEASNHSGLSTTTVFVISVATSSETSEIGLRPAL